MTEKQEMGKILQGNTNFCNHSTKIIMYTAAVIQTNHLALLKQSIHLPERVYIYQTELGHPLPHHMTINLGAFSPLNPSEILGQNCKMTINSIYQNDKLGVCAAKVETAKCEIDGVIHIIKTINDEYSCKHITICIQPGSKPMWSNRMFKSNLPTTIIHKLKQPIVVEGIITECK